MPVDCGLLLHAYLYQDGHTACAVHIHAWLLCNLVWRCPKPCAAKGTMNTGWLMLLIMSAG